MAITWEELIKETKQANNKDETKRTITMIRKAKNLTRMGRAILLKELRQ